MDPLEYKKLMMDPICMYLQDRVIPEDEALFRQIAHGAKMYTLVDGVVYRKGAHGVLMRCISRKQGRELLEEIHGGVCRVHASFRTLIGKAFRQGLWFSMMRARCLQGKAMLLYELKLKPPVDDW